MRILKLRICILPAVLLLLALPHAVLACGTEAVPREDLPPDAVWMDVVYRSYDPDEIRVTRILTQSPGVSLRDGPSAAASRIRGVPADTVLDVIRHVPGWYYVRYRGDTGYVNDSSEFVLIIGCITPEPQTPTPTPVVTPTLKPATPTPNRNPSEMAIPQLGDRVCRAGEVSLTVFWTQTQLAATGRWYQEDGCAVTGCLDEATLTAVSAFMDAQGHPGHSGEIGQDVIDGLTDFLGSRTVAVYTGGFYDAMSVLMDGGADDSMTPVGRTDLEGIVPSGAKVFWVQTCLAFLGYYSGPVSGTYSEATRTAVRLFELDNGFEAQDTVGLGVARAMLEAYYYNRGDLGQLP